MRLAASVFEFASEGILITDADGVIVDVNPAFVRITGYLREEAMGQTPRILKSDRHTPEFYENLWQNLRKTGHWSGEVWNHGKDGRLFPERLSITAIRNTHGGVTHFIGVFSDISLEKQQEAQLKHLAQHDALTGLPNRILLADRMHQAIAQAEREGKWLAVGYLDLDGFKPINDSYGHEAGDRLLVEMARRMSQALRSTDTVARLGGDEFTLLLQGLNTLEECHDALKRLLTTIAQPVALDDGQIVNITASIGVSLYPHDDEDPDTLLRHADQAMYVAKQAGRNRYHFHDVEGDRLARSHWETRQRIHKALEENELELHYQPQIDMRNGKVTGVEALIRWRHPEQGLLTPASFLPVIENSELDVRLGEWVLRQSLQQLGNWSQQGLNIRLGVNISAYHIQQPDFLDRLRALLAHYPQADPNKLELEILETAALEDLGGVSDVIRTCQKIGSHFALDDFGTGYSSLTYLRHLPVHTLKIDQSFVHDMLREPDDLAIVEGVIALAEAFGRDVIAEGVDSLESGLLLLQLGCPAAQGYSIARPMPAEELHTWMDNWNSPSIWSEDNFRRWRKEDFALLLAEYNHQEWINALTDLVNGDAARHDPVEPDHRFCRFGRWYQGSGQLRYGHMEAFSAIGPIHQKVHELGQALLEQVSSSNITHARQGLSELYAVRDELLSRLHTLQRQILQK